MIVAIPMGPDAIHRAAERMIDDYGSEALVRAERRVRRLQMQDLEPLAEIWDLISEVIRDLEDARRHSGIDWRI